MNKQELELTKRGFKKAIRFKDKEIAKKYANKFSAETEIVKTNLFTVWVNKNNSTSPRLPVWSKNPLVRNQEKKAFCKENKIATKSNKTVDLDIAIENWLKK